jgi:hypothetical protein
VAAAWLAEECLDQRDRGGAADRQWLAAAARDRPLRAWLPERFFGRLTPAERQLACAVAVLRAFTLGAMEAMLPGPPGLPGGLMSTDRFDRLRRKSFIQQLPAAPPGRPQWRMHPLIRTWILAYLDTLDADRPPQARELPRLHRLAADYHEALAAGGFSLEAAYHRFASSDPGPAPAWRARMLQAARADELDQALSHAGAALAPELAGLPALPAVAAAAAHTAAYVACRQARLDDAARLAGQAQAACAQAGDPAGEAAALLLAGQVAWRRFDWTRAARSWRQALDLRRQHRIAGPPGELAILRALAEVSAGRGQLRDADQLLARALSQPAPLRGPAAHAVPGAGDDLPAVGLASDVPPHQREAHQRAHRRPVAREPGSTARDARCTQVLPPRPAWHRDRPRRDGGLRPGIGGGPPAPGAGDPAFPGPLPRPA